MSETTPLKFLMLFPGRTGSSHLMQKLRSHPELRMQGEILDEFLGEPSLERSIEYQLDRTRTFFGYTVKPHVKAFGFKTKIYPHKWNSEGLERLKEVLCESGVSRIIVLLRANRVKRAVSAIRGQMLNIKHGSYHHVRGEMPVGPVPIDPVLLKKTMEVYDEWTALVTRFAETLEQPKLRLHYEEILQDEEGVMCRLFELLGVDYHPTTARILKHTPDDLSSIVTNFDELCHYFRGTPVEGQLMEGVICPGNPV